jgi:hypothetical protein
MATAAQDMGRDDVRPADLAIAGNRMLIELLLMIWRRRYNRNNPKLGATLELMMVSMQTSIWTREGTPPTLSELEKKLLISHGQVDRHLKTLMKEGSVTKIGMRYHANLDRLDQLLTSRAHLETAMAIIKTCLDELERLGVLLADKLKVLFLFLSSLVLSDNAAPFT